jgi:hypothetical protein
MTAVMAHTIRPAIAMKKKVFIDLLSFLRPQ